MTDKPAESAVERYNALEWVPDGEMGFDPGGREVKAAADALIAALEAEVEGLESELRDLTVEYLSSGPWCEECGRVTNEANNPEHPGKCNACQRAEAAEAEAAKEALLAQEAFERMQKAEAMKQEWMKAANVNLDRAEAAEARAKDWEEAVHIEEARVSTLIQEAEAERDRLKWMLVRSVCDECLVHTSGACSEEECEDCPPVRDALVDLAARYDARHEGGDG